MDDTESMLLNDGTHTFTSYSCASKALNIAITSSEIFSQCSWRVMNTIGSDHFPFLIEFKKRQKVRETQEMFWNFKKSKWESYRDSMDIKLSLTPFTNDLEENWKNFRTIILDDAKAFIPRGNIRRHIPFFTHYASSLKPLLDKKDELHKSLGDGSLNLRTEINKINAEIKLIYTQLKRSRWK
ncbi:uncharacterized protein TNCT_608091 [Trichonephila clavata]|uniref:Endonuclease/exonuclease/phosphatase domain-containing protein n=1 Tax=Trichonephila clavata TaxID=2740835 RepID=A0A8X6K754_TRICU|nr:uncharacterized protein TNCT_608091 [Trichonephila clavata]